MISDSALLPLPLLPMIATNPGFKGMLKSNHGASALLGVDIGTTEML